MSLSKIERKLFFLVGCRRSGTTLLKAMLNTHPGIFIPPETFFYSSIVKPYANLRPRGDKVDWVCSRWWIRDAGIQKQRLEEVTSQENSFSEWGQIFLGLLAVLSGGRDFQAIGEKTPSHINVADKLLAEFPHSRIIHIVRDPRAVLASSRRVVIGTNQPAGIVREWKAAWWMHKKLANNNQYLMLQYEDLVVTPEKVLRMICQHLNVDYQAEMLTFHLRGKAGYSVEQVHHDKTMTPLFSTSIAKWKSQLRPASIALLEQHLQGGMKEFGYKPVNESSRAIFGHYRLSELLETLHRNLIRRPRQFGKKMRALKRLGELGGREKG